MTKSDEVGSPPGGGRASGPPPLPVRLMGKGLSALIVRVPAMWPLLRRPSRRFWNKMAQEWDHRIDPQSPDHLAPLLAACERVERSPRRILEIGTGTGAGAIWLAGRFPQAQVVGVDLSPAMVQAATAKNPSELDQRLRFIVADANDLPFENREFDLITQLNVPVYVDELTRVAGAGCSIIVASSLGPATPYFTPHSLLRRRFEGR